MTPGLHDQIRERVDDFLAKNDLPGLSVAVVTTDPKDGSAVTTTFAAGVPTKGSLQPVDSSTVFEIGSVTKAFTSDLLAYLLATGRVHLDDPLQDYAPPGVTVPTYQDDGVPITIGDLATHQAGLPDAPPNADAPCGGGDLDESQVDVDQDVDVDGRTCNPNPLYTQTMLWDALSSQTHLLWDPGTRWYYSNFGFSLLGCILSSLIQPGGSQSDPPPFQPALDATFLNALGMSSTMLEDPPPATPPGPRLATPYAIDGSRINYQLGTNANAPTGGLISDATDMGTWMAAHLGYVSPTAPLGVRTMQNTLQQVGTVTLHCSKPVASDCTAAEFQSGLVWQLYPAGSSNIDVAWALKNGGTAGFSTDTALAPTLHAGVTTMTNRESIDDPTLATEILALLVAQQPSPTPVPTTPTPPGSTATTALADSGSNLFGPGMGAATLLAIGMALAGGSTLTRVRRRRRGTDASR
jgi:D-alanyl-D-alanine-carboxypeptidase/D-alanyl-D-alanine-endopeptidase